MAVRNPPSWLQAGSHPAEHDRLLISSLLRQGGGVSGIVRSTDLAVSANGTPNMSVNVAAGACFIAGSEQTYQGTYHAVNDATVNLAISTAPGSGQERYDLVVFRVQDSAYSGGTNAGSLAVVTGTAAAVGSAADPTVPANSLVLARVYVGPNVTSITNANITDRRTQISAIGGIIVCTSSSRPTSNIWKGLFIFETDTLRVLFYDGSSWVRVGDQGLPPGALAPTIFTNPPTDWVLCYGQTIANAQTLYPVLWAGLDSAFKSGSSLVVPDLRGRVPAGKDNMGGSAANRITSGTSNISGTTMGATGGNQAIASHKHTFNMYAGYTLGISAGRGPDAINLGGNPSGTEITNFPNIPNEPGHGNMQPTIILNWMLKLR